MRVIKTVLLLLFIESILMSECLSNVRQCETLWPATMVWYHSIHSILCIVSIVRNITMTRTRTQSHFLLWAQWAALTSYYTTQTLFREREERWYHESTAHFYLSIQQFGDKNKQLLYWVIPFRVYILFQSNILHTQCPLYKSSTAGNFVNSNPS